MPKKKLVKTISTARTFNYQIDNVALNFTLNIDNTSDMAKFNRLLETAVKDVTAALEDAKNS